MAKTLTLWGLTNLKKHLAVEELVVAGDEIPPVVTIQLILLPGLGD